jgi:predicted secreted protein
MLLYVINLLATFARATIVLYKTSLVRSKSSLAFLEVIAQSLFVERSSLATQAHKRAVLTTISLSKRVIGLFYLLLEIFILNYKCGVISETITTR